jgi:hypothetical protein
MAIQINGSELTFNENIVSGFASSSGIIDGQGMVMSNEELEKMVTAFMIKYKLNEATIDANHGIKNVAYIIESQILKTTDDRRKWWLSVKLFNEDVINKIKQSGVSGMSISGNAKERTTDDGVIELQDIDLTEVSVLYPEAGQGEPNRPANPEAIPTMVKRMNKLISICKSLFNPKNKETQNMDQELQKSIEELTKSIEGIPSLVDEKINNRLTEFDKSLAERFVEKAKKAEEEDDEKEKEEEEEKRKAKKNLNEIEEMKKSLAEASAQIEELKKAHESEVTEIKKKLTDGVQSNQNDQKPAVDKRTAFQKVYDANKEANEKTGLK